MGILLAFAPFVAFAVIDRLLGAPQGLLAGAAVSAVLVGRGWFGAGWPPKTLDVGTFILFGGLALYTVAAHPAWSIFGVRLCVDAGLLSIVMVSLVVGRPFTLQYAREQVPEAQWASPIFLRTNQIITAAWALAFAVMVAADLVLVFVPSLPPRFGIVVTVLALVGAFKFTAWYPERIRAAL